MATYYVGSGGNDASAGTSWGARWLTIGKALGASGIASGDTVYLGPGTYREVVTVAMTSATAETLVIGDVDGSHTSGSPGPVVWTAYTTNDTSAPSASIVCDLSGRDYLTFRNIWFVGGQSATAATINAATTTSTNITFTLCSFTTGFPTAPRLIAMTVGAGVNAAWLFDRCSFIGAGRNVTDGTIAVTLTRHTADYDANIVAKNCLFIEGPAYQVRIASTGAGTGFGGGVIMNACSVFSFSGAMQTGDANLSTSIPCQVNNSFLWCGSTALSANTSGQITESYNSILAATARSNVTAGTGSQTTYAPLTHFGQELDWGGLLRPFGTPTPSSPLLGFGAGTSPPTVDRLNRDRPSGGAATTIAAGAFERHDFGTKETGTTDAGSVALKLTGPGDHDLQIPVDATSTTIAVKVYYDTNHGTGSPPQAQLIANGEIGFAGETKTAAASTGTWLTLTFSAFTPTAKSYVTLRLRSRAAAASGYAIFDTISVT